VALLQLHAGGHGHGHRQQSTPTARCMPWLCARIYEPRSRSTCTVVRRRPGRDETAAIEESEARGGGRRLRVRARQALTAGGDWH
jgi:hypothetical protein